MLKAKHKADDQETKKRNPNFAKPRGHWSGGCVVLEWLWEDTPCPRAEKPQQDGRLRSTGAAAALVWSDFEEITHVPGQRRSPRKAAGGAKSCLESNPVPARDAQWAQTNLVGTRTQRPHRDWDRTVFECLLWRYGSAVDWCKGRGYGCSRPGCGISPLGGGCH